MEPRPEEKRTQGGVRHGFHRQDAQQVQDWQGPGPRKGLAGPPAILTRATKGEAQRASDGTRQVTEQVKDAGKNVRKAFKP
jgi:hypothetical protein